MEKKFTLPDKIQSIAISESIIGSINAADAEFTKFNNQRSLVMKSDIKTKKMGDATALLDVHRPDEDYYNRVVGLGGLGIKHIDEIIAWYNDHQVQCRISLSPVQQESSLIHLLNSKGLIYNGHDCIFIAAAQKRPSHLPQSIEMDVISEANLDVLFTVLGQENPTIKKDLIRQNRQFYTRPDFLFYMVRVNGNPAAIGSIFIFNTIAWLSNDMTIEAHRGMGCQRYLIQERINVAAQLGCELVVTDTDFGTISHRNMLRSGFHLAYMTAEFKQMT